MTTDRRLRCPGLCRHPAGNEVRTNKTPSAMMAVWSEAFLMPLVTELRASRETIADQAEQIGALRTERDTARAELERAATTAVALGDELDRLAATSAAAPTATETAGPARFEADLSRPLLSYPE
jgi:hypothetical protein